MQGWEYAIYGKKEVWNRTISAIANLMHGNRNIINNIKEMISKDKHGVKICEEKQNE